MAGSTALIFPGCITDESLDPGSEVIGEANALEPGDDPFDPASCTGDAVTVDELAAMRPESQHHLGPYEFAVRYRDCRILYGEPDPYPCGPWTDGNGDIADAELRGNISIEKQSPASTDPTLSLRFDSDVECGQFPFILTDYGMWVWTSPYGDKSLVSAEYTVPRRWRQSPCLATPLIVPNRPRGNLTGHCLRLEGSGWETSLDGLQRREYMFALVTQYE